MDYLDEINGIINKLEISNKKLISNEVISLKEGASTSSELLMSITHKLYLLIKQDECINRLIGKEVIQLKNYCNSIGLQITD